eukprot:687818-Alexandrium_andersonii.AAC.1
MAALHGPRLSLALCRDADRRPFAGGCAGCGASSCAHVHLHGPWLPGCGHRLPLAGGRWHFAVTPLAAPWMAAAQAASPAAAL